jgi:hypothetical protein
MRKPAPPLNAVLAAAFCSLVLAGIATGQAGKPLQAGNRKQLLAALEKEP